MVNAICIIGDLFELLAKIQYFDKTLTKKLNCFLMLAIWMIVFILDEYMAPNVKSVWSVAVFFTLMFLCIFGLYEGQFKKKIITIFFVSVFQMIAEFVADIIIVFVNGVGNNQSVYIMGYIISKIIFFIFIRISIHFNKRKNEYNMGNKTFMSILFVPALCIFIVGLFVLSSPDKSNYTYYDVLFYIVILIINYLTVIQYDDVQKMLYLNNRNALLEKQKMYYIQQYEQTKKMWDLMSSMRHNMKNEYISQSILLKDKEYDKLNELYYKRIGELEASKVISVSGNVYIDTIVNYKVSMIREMEADFECKIIVPSKLNIDSEDIILVLGNLLDNVIDAFDNEILLKKSGRLVIVYEKSNLYIEIKNTYKGDRKKNRNGEYITTKKIKEMHGLGIKSVNSVVKKYDGYMKIEENNNIFSVNVLLQI